MSTVLTVNAGSTSLKLCLVEGEDSRPADGFEPADAVGHRVVHGGARYVEPVLIDDAVEQAIDELSHIAPLHNTPALRASVGMGLACDSPLGNLRVDYAYPIMKQPYDKTQALSFGLRPF